ncbi:hypothetical protein IHE45_09G040500 [Dioscorea alata]|uniref:Uncharacterized protein n=1 Tax=Dioscorea alata TaxID=55571 RepID=A0ACB7VEM6_DIOAL|nr:hypothetical protein IHE45_09G040500 [Dioscorea alata]
MLALGPWSSRFLILSSKLTASSSGPVSPTLSLRTLSRFTGRPNAQSETPVKLVVVHCFRADLTVKSNSTAERWQDH